MEIGRSMPLIYQMIAVGLVLDIGVIVLDQQQNITNNYMEGCNNKYGVDGWITVEANSSERPPHYLGQVQVCRPKLNITA